MDDLLTHLFLGARMAVAPYPYAVLRDVTMEYWAAVAAGYPPTPAIVLWAQAPGEQAR